VWGVVYGWHEMSSTLEIFTASEDETMQLGAAIGSILRPDDVVLLYGELGSGKTRLAKGLVSAATGADPREVVSPTFALIHRFDGLFPVFHVDLYRLEGDALDHIGLDDALESDGVLVVEWPERAEWLELDALQVFVTFGPEETGRMFSFHWRRGSAWQDRLTRCLKK
jgi:tRNA threonylcarbamoyl adenosine modification protein YjeE